MLRRPTYLALCSLALTACDDGAQREEYTHRGDARVDTPAIDNTDLHKPPKEDDDATGSTSEGGTSESGGASEGGDAPICGNGIVEEDEQCDDGNAFDGDGCNADCTDPCGDGQVIYVDIDAAPGGDGSSWSNAYNVVQDALDAASPGDDLWIAAGVYLPVVPEATLADLVTCVDLYGGFAGTETSLEERPDDGLPTVFDGDFYGDDFFPDTWFDNAWHVVEGSDVENIVIDRVVMEQGRGGNDFTGGGVYLLGGKVVLRDAEVRFNHSLDGGGAPVLEESTLWTYNTEIRSNTGMIGAGVHVDDTSTVVLGSGTEVTNNVASDRGAGLASIGGRVLVDGAAFEDNLSGNVYQPLPTGDGGGVYSEGEGASLTVEDAVFSGNGGDNGGAIFVTEMADPVTIRSSAFTENEAFYGGAIAVYGPTPLLVETSTFEGNSTWDAASGIGTSGAVQLDECKFLENVGGGAVRAGIVKVRKSTFDQNESSYDGGAIRVFGGIVSENNEYRNNTANEGGGAVSIVGNGKSEFRRDQFASNDTNGDGGAIRAVSENAIVSVLSSTFRGNEADGAGGAVALEISYRVSDSVFTFNSASEGAGVYADAASKGRIANSSFWKNSAANGAATGGVYVEPGASSEIRNVTMWSNGLDLGGQAPEVTDFACTQTPASGSTTVQLGADPFIPGAGGELYLHQDSPCIDLGSNDVANQVYFQIYGYLFAWTALTTDINGALDVPKADPAHHYEP
ncbi:MAG: myxococcus cysteine-rich repeat containing protein [Myxococcota bacterium]